MGAKERSLFENVFGVEPTFVGMDPSIDSASDSAQAGDTLGGKEDMLRMFLSLECSASVRRGLLLEIGEQSQGIKEIPMNMFDLVVNYDRSTVTIIGDVHPAFDLTLDLDRFRTELEREQ